MDLKKTNAAQTTETYNKEVIEEKTNNIYEAISIIAKRAEQIKGDVKKELIDKLEEFATYNDSLEEILDDIKNQVFKCSPNAIAITKKVITVDQYLDPEKAADLFSDCVVSYEGKEGFNSFFEKRKPSWVPNKKRKNNIED